MIVRMAVRLLLPRIGINALPYYCRNVLLALAVVPLRRLSAPALVETTRVVVRGGTGDGETKAQAADPVILYSASCRCCFVEGFYLWEHMA